MIEKCALSSEPVVICPIFQLFLQLQHDIGTPVLQTCTEAIEISLGTLQTFVAVTLTFFMMEKRQVISSPFVKQLKMVGLLLAYQTVVMVEYSFQATVFFLDINVMKKNIVSNPWFPFFRGGLERRCYSCICKYLVLPQ